LYSLVLQKIIETCLLCGISSYTHKKCVCAKRMGGKAPSIVDKLVSTY